MLFTPVVFAQCCLAKMTVSFKWLLYSTDQRKGKRHPRLIRGLREINPRIYIGWKSLLPRLMQGVDTDGASVVCVWMLLIGETHGVTFYSDYDIDYTPSNKDRASVHRTRDVAITVCVAE